MAAVAGAAHDARAQWPRPGHPRECHAEGRVRCGLQISGQWHVHWRDQLRGGEVVGCSRGPECRHERGGQECAKP
ncbi:hypothetical protein BIWAKO_01741 [Bosea sp. BIWAKO-01]|nr:hypothetical protein BIWAKO_01741 [Bosea sp. BIWAKO-01]